MLNIKERGLHMARQTLRCFVDYGTVACSLLLLTAMVFTTRTHAVPLRLHHASIVMHAPIAQYARALRYFNNDLSRNTSTWFAIHVLREAQKRHLDARLLVALVATESAWHPQAVSEVGARGLGQLMPGTAAELGADPREPYSNLAGTAKYLAMLRDRFAKYDRLRQYKYAIGAYNAGPGAIAYYHGIPPYPETREYVVKVIGLWHGLSGTHRISAQLPVLPATPRRPAVLASLDRGS